MLRSWIWMGSVRAAASTPFSHGEFNGLPGLFRTAMRLISGTASFKSDNCFAASSGPKEVSPVRFLLGRRGPAVVQKVSGRAGGRRGAPPPGGGGGPPTLGERAPRLARA